MKKDAGIGAVLNAILPGLGWLYGEYIFIGIISIFIEAFFVYLFIFHYKLLYSFLYILYWILSINLVCNAIKKANINRASDKNMFQMARDLVDGQQASDVNKPSIIKSLVDNLKE